MFGITSQTNEMESIVFPGICALWNALLTMINEYADEECFKFVETLPAVFQQISNTACSAIRVSLGIQTIAPDQMQ